MDFRIFRYYIVVCRVIEQKPSFKGLEEFKKYYDWERRYNGRSKVVKNKS